MKILNKISKTSVLKYLFFSILVIFALSNQNFSQSLNLDTSFSGGVSDAPATVFISATQADGKILVGGDFSFANGIKKAFLARLNSDGTLDQTFNASGSGADNSVYEIKILSNGKILIGGAFTAYNGVTKSGLARLNFDGSLDTTFNPSGAGVSGTIQGLTLQADGKILISGFSVTSYNGVQIFNLIRVNENGTLDTTFTSPFSTISFIEEVDVQTDGKILIGGTFSVGNPMRTNIARLNQNGTVDNTFNPSGGGTNGGVYAMTIQMDGKILIGGDFSNYNGTFRTNYARLNADGSLDNNFGSSGFDNPAVEYFDVQPDGKILVAGKFSSFQNEIMPVIRLNADGSFDNSFKFSEADGAGRSIKLQSDGKIIATGNFVKYGGKDYGGIVRLNSDGSIDNAFNASFSAIGEIFDIALQPDGKILVGGIFRSANGRANTNIARFNADGTIDTTFETGTGTRTDSISLFNFIYDVTVQSDGKILVGGSFSGFNGQNRTSIVRLNSNGSVDTSFNTYFINPSQFSLVRTIFVQSDGKILVGGYFLDSTFGQFYNGLVRLNPDGSTDSTFKYPDNVIRGQVLQIAQQADGKIIIGGTFVTVDGRTSSRIARLNLDGTLDTSFNVGSGANIGISDIVLQPDGKILIGGSFTAYNGTSRNHFARLNSNGLLDTTFDVGTGANNIVYDILQQADGKILIGGNFTSYNGNPANKLARINADGSFDDSFVSGFDNDARNSVREIVQQADGSILVGGIFDSYNGIARNNLLRLTASNQARTRFDFDGDGRADISVFRPSNSVWYLNQSTDGFSGFQFGISTDKIAPADFDGDGKTDIAVFRNGTWYLLRSSKGFAQIQFGASGDIPVPADFDGDGAAELAVYRGGVWYSYNLATNETNIVQFGIASDVPVIGDFDGDNKNDYAVYRPSNGTWYVLNSTDGFTAIQFGISTDKPVVGDYDGDGRDDLAVFRSGIWYLLNSTRGFTSFQFGISTDLPAPADFDGDGKTDAAVFRNGVWYILGSTSGVQIVQFGITGDKPTPNAFVR